MYKTVGILPLDDYRELASCKFVIRTSSKINFIQNELKLRSDIDFPKRAVNISSQKTIATYTNNLISMSETNLANLPIRPSNIPIPPWEIPKPIFDIKYTDVKKSENMNILTLDFKLHSDKMFKDHLQIFTDGSMLDNKDAGAAFVIPTLKIEKFFFLGNNLSIFTAELTAVMSALQFLLEISNKISKAVVFVDSKSVLSTLSSLKSNSRPDLVFEIYNLLYQLSIKNTIVEFCWVPSHCFIHGNEMADKAARKGSNKSPNYINMPIIPSTGELLRCLEKVASEKSILSSADKLYHFSISWRKANHEYSSYQQRQLTSLAFRLKLDSFKTKFVKNVYCCCGEKISRDHILFTCGFMRMFLPVSLTNIYKSIEDLPALLQDSPVLMDTAKNLFYSPLGRLL